MQIIQNRFPETHIATEHQCLEEELSFGAKGLFSEANWLFVSGSKKKHPAISVQ